MDNVKGLSESNIRYAKRFYDLYSGIFANLQQPAENSSSKILQQPAETFDCLTSIPWTHHPLYPENFKSSLPSIEEIENELNDK